MTEKERVPGSTSSTGRPVTPSRSSAFYPVVDVGDHYRVANFGQGYDPSRISLDPPSIGRYHEKRRNMYTTDLFDGERDVHVGLDFWVPAGTPVFAFDDGEVLLFRDNARPGDYGPTIITRHSGPGVQALLSGLHDAGRIGFPDAPDKVPEVLFALYGHLSRDFLNSVSIGMPVRRGNKIAHVGREHENGGWVPHLHFQLAIEPPGEPDMPGVVTEADLPEALQQYPDPQWITGRYY